MSSNILYKFRSATTFEALPLPGSAARLFDVKKAIVVAKKLDQAGAMEFDLSVRNAATDEEYADENMLLPRGTRLVIQRLPAPRGHGFLSRMARHPYGGGGGGAMGGGAAPPQQAGNANFYTIDTRTHGEEDEFVPAAPAAAAAQQEDQELAALHAATSAANQAARNMVPAAMMGRGAGGFRGGPHVAGQGPPPPPPPPPQGGAANQGLRQGQQPHQQGNFVPRPRLNADPELRDQEKQLMPKKRATGIPRTFLNLNAPPQTDAGAGGGGEGGENVPLLQPNAIGFEELVNRGGGQSENAPGFKRDLDYALKLTATTVPEYLQCAICHNVVRDAMILPWDPEGRTTCESCIRDALTQNGFRCPLTGQEGVSPDDLLPNHALRKAAEQFVKGVMEKMEEIEKQQVEDYDDTAGAADAGHSANSTSILDGEGADKGVIISKRTSIADRKKKQEEDDPFGGDDLFGGDVFAVASEKPEEQEEAEQAGKETPNPQSENASKVKVEESAHQPSPEKQQQVTSTIKTESKEPDSAGGEATEQNNGSGAVGDSSRRRGDRNRSLSPTPDNREKTSPDTAGGRRDVRRRGPPIGYSMGPAGGAVGGPREDAPVSTPRNRGDTGAHGGGGEDDHGERGHRRRHNYDDEASEGYRGHSRHKYSDEHQSDSRGGRSDDYGGRRRGEEEYAERGGGRQRHYQREYHNAPAGDTSPKAEEHARARSPHAQEAGDFHHDDHRGTKRPRSDSDAGGGRDAPRQHDERYGRDHRGGRGRYGSDQYQGRGGGRGGFRGGGYGGRGGYSESRYDDGGRGGRSGFEERGGGRGGFRGGRRGGRGGHRGGRGRY